MYKTVKIKTIDGRELKGEVVDYENAIENDLECDEIGIDYKTHIEVVEENEIKSIEVICE
jgi:small nuclear ribonucleoprotein (snRNP)-like protein